MKLRYLLVLSLIAGSPLPAEQKAAATGTTVINAGRLIDTAAGTVLTNQTIVVVDGRISTVVPTDALAAMTFPSDARFIDLSGATVMPGLIDCHTHITSQPENYYEDLFRKSPIDYAVSAHIFARRTLEAGFTTVRDVGSLEYIDISLKRAIDNGSLAGPRILPAAVSIGATGGHADISGFSPTIRFDQLDGVADGVDAIRKKVRENIKYGAEWIKIMATAGVLSEEESVGAPQYHPEEMRAAVEEAAMWGKKVAAHAHGTDGVKRAIRAGVASVEHASFIDDEGIELAIRNGTFLVMDIYNDDYILSEFARLGFPQKLIEKEKLVGRTQRENFQKAVRAGVKIAFGTDAGVFPHGWNAKQFAHMVRWGMTPMQAVQAATVVAADLLDRESEIGRIAPGFHADIVAVGGDPMADVTILENVGFVMKGGDIFKNSLTADPVKQLK